MPSTHPDHRLFHRIAHDAPALITLEDSALTARTLDLSLRGCLLEIDPAVALGIGIPYSIEIHLSEDVRIAMRGALIHRQERRAGFKCEHIDLDSISTLRRLVELNLGDPELLDRDLEALAAHSPS